ncbi:MAG: tetratricopeptide repeat protein [Thermoflexaceae bacterium]|nr:tetratricopeptide repeat protein [Thermoflexaceae bacterium]
MSNDPTIEMMSPEERTRLRKQMSEQAVKLAVSGRWEDAASLNREFVRLFPDDAEGYNRLGKSLTELGQVSEARQCYGKALEIDPTNQIARRNLDRLATLKDAAGTSAPSQLDTRMFIEETGKAAVTILQAVDPALAATLDAGDLVELRQQGNAVNVHTMAGDYVGMVEPRVGLRLARMMEGGNRYSAALVSVTDNEIKVIIRETYQHPSLIGRVSFPQARAVAAVRPYTRRGLLRGAHADEIEFGDDDEYREDDEDDGWSETGEDLERETGADLEHEDESFD